MSPPTTTVAYTLDGLGRTAKRTATGAATVDYTYEGTSEILVKAATSSSSTTTIYSSTPSGPLAQKTGTATPQVLLRDLHGDVVASVVTTATAMAAPSFYSAWGERTGTTSALGSQGQWTDPATSQVDMTTRMYVASLGRFSTRDVLFGDLASPMGLNQFAYANAGPVTFTDPAGMCPVDRDCPPPASFTDAAKDDWMEWQAGRLTFIAPPVVYGPPAPDTLPTPDVSPTPPPEDGGILDGILDSLDVPSAGDPSRGGLQWCSNFDPYPAVANICKGINGVLTAININAWLKSHGYEDEVEELQCSWTGAWFDRSHCRQVELRRLGL